MDTSPLLLRTNIPIAVKQLFGKAIGNVTLVFVLLPHCRKSEQWGYTSNGNREVTITFPINFNNIFIALPVIIAGGNNAYANCVKSYSKTSIKIGDSGCSGHFWFAIGN